MCVCGGGEGGGVEGVGMGGVHVVSHGSLVHCRVVMLNATGGNQLQEAARATQTVAGLFVFFCFVLKERRSNSQTRPLTHAIGMAADGRSWRGMSREP